MVVNIGGLQDPKGADGLAHFTEHLVHYGSEKFPREEEFWELLFNFGLANAETNQFTTNYYNLVPDMILEKNLERFSEMLTNPLMKLEFLEREAHVLDDEFHIKRSELRKPLVFTHVACTFSQEIDHPFLNFWIGSLETLGGSKTNVVFEEMKKNIKNNYVASAMTLVINSTKPIDELEKLTLKHFSNLNEGTREVRHKTEQNDANHQLKLDLEGRYIFLEGISNRSELALIWHLPAEVWMKDKNDKTMLLINLLLANTSEKGLIALLKEEGLIYNAEVNHNETPYAVILEIDYKLTEKGRIPENTVRIQETTFQYTKHLQQLNELEIKDYFDQIRIAQLREFHYGSQKSNIQTTLGCAMRMQNVERPQEVINFDSWENATLNFARICDTLKRLNPTPSEDDEIPGVTVIETLPKNELLEVKMTEFQEKVKDLKIQEEPYTKARYFCLPRSAIINDVAPMENNNAGVFTLPRIIPYLKTEVDHLRNEVQKPGGGDMDDANPFLRFLIAPVNHGNIGGQTPLKFESRMDLTGNTATPKISGVLLGHKDSTLDPYRATVLIKFHTSEHRASTARGSTLNWLWTLYISQSLAKYKTEFSGAGVDFSVLRKEKGVISITIEGFPTYLEDITGKIVRKVFGDPITENAFFLAKEELKHVMEKHLADPGNLANQFIDNIFFYDKEITIDCLGLARELTFADLRNMVNSHKMSTYVKVDLSGNVPATYFQNLAVTLDEMDFRPSTEQMPLRNSIPRHDLHHPGETCVRVKNFANCGYNNTVTNLYILGKSSESDEHQAQCFIAASKFMNYQALLHFRNREQLAYIVGAGTKELGGVKMIHVTVIVTAEKHAICEVDQKIDEFMAKYGNYFEELPDDIYDLMSQMTGNITVTKNQIAEYFRSKFGEDFGIPDRENKCRKKGIRKVSIQELAWGNPTIKHKACTCTICGGISHWRKGQAYYESSLEFAIGDKGNEEYFIALPID